MTGVGCNNEGGCVIIFLLQWTTQEIVSGRTLLLSRASCRPSKYCLGYPATNQEHFERAQQSQEVGADPQERERHPRVRPHHENRWRQEKSIEWARPHRGRNVKWNLLRKRHFNFQKAENSRIQQQITSLKGEKTALQQQLLGLQRRITELEMQVGSEAHWYNRFIINT